MNIYLYTLLLTNTKRIPFDKLILAIMNQYMHAVSGTLASAISHKYTHI